MDGKAHWGRRGELDYLREDYKEPGETGDGLAPLAFNGIDWLRFFLMA